jgi:hypothetical protein
MYLLKQIFLKGSKQSPPPWKMYTDRIYGERAVQGVEERRGLRIGGVGV